MKKELYNALEILKKGGLILYPTDTIWGVGCDASNSDAIEKIYALKQREEAKALINRIKKPLLKFNFTNLL